MVEIDTMASGAKIQLVCVFSRVEAQFGEI
jgi:hypothetical protein